jgi:hypothetical protein
MSVLRPARAKTGAAAPAETTHNAASIRFSSAVVIVLWLAVSVAR